MNVFDRMVTWAARALRFHPSQTPPAWVKALGGWETASGVEVNAATALQYSAVWACTRVLSETVASLPLHLYRRLPGGGKERAVDHPLYRILHDDANDETTSFYFRETLMGHLCGWGNAYAEIEINGRGQVIGLWGLRPDRMKVERENSKLKYTYRLNRPDSQGQHQHVFAPEQVLHVPGLGFDGVVGYSPIRMARQAIGLGLATEEFGARFFGNDARPGIVLQHPDRLSKDARETLQKSWTSKYGTLAKSHSVAILEEGLQLVEIGIPPEDAQFLQTRKFQRSEIASIYRVPPHKIGIMDAATFSNIEHQSIEFVVDTIRPWLVRWEQVLNTKLLLPSERGKYFTEFLVDGLLRGDIKSRYEAYAVGRMNGFLNANEIRELENMNPFEGGDVYLVPLNMIPISAVGAFGPTPGMESNARVVALAPTEERATRSAIARRRLQQAYHRIYRDVAARVLRREKNDVGAAARKYLGTRGIGDFSLWMEQFYAEHGRFVFDQFSVVARAYGELVAAEAHAEVGEPGELTPADEMFVRQYLAAFTARHTGLSQSRIARILQEEVDPLAAIEAELDTWPEVRAEETARWEAVRFGNALSKAVFVSAGIIKLRWRAFGKSCPYCRDLDGQVVGINEMFLQAGTEYEPDGADRPLTVQHSIGHAPAHAGCLPGNAYVLAGNRIAASSERWYDGNLVVIRTSSGNQLTSTPNHPVLTNAGWIAAGGLNVGDYVISDRSIDWMRPRMPVIGDHQYMPASIHDIAKSFCDAGEMVTIPVPATAEDFHGDGGHSEITIVRANRELLSENGAALVQQLSKGALLGGNAGAPVLASTSSSAISRESVGLADGGFVGRRDLRGSFVGASAVPDQRLRSAPFARLDVFFQQVPSDYGAGHIQFGSEGVFGLPGDVFADQVVAIEQYAFHGSVYNLQTENGYYIANGIIVHNCDCMVVAG